MAEAAYNLVTITGNRNELEKFEKIAYKNNSEAFTLGNFIGYQGETTIPYHSIFDTNWVAFSVLINKTEDSLKYFFNSKWNAANLRYIVDRFSDLQFKQVYVEIVSEKVGIEYYNTDKKLELDNFDYWKNSCSPHTYNFIEELAIKLEYLLSESKVEPTGKHFFEQVDRTQFINEHRSQYEAIIKNTLKLEKQDLFYARYGVFYNLHFHKKEKLEQFIQNNIQAKKQEYFLDELNQINFNITRERRFWNFLSLEWRMNLVESLCYFNSPFYSDDYDEKFELIFFSIQNSDEYIKDILKLDRIFLPLPLLYDYLETILAFLPELKKIYIDFEGYGSKYVFDDLPFKLSFPPN